MRKPILLLGVLILLLPICLFAGPTEPEDVLRQADLKRGPWEKFTLNAQIFAEGKQDSYRVFFKNDTKTLVYFRTPAPAKGNLLLMLADQLWFYVKDTRTPIRITPLQRMAGSVSYGDVARLFWVRK